MKVFLTPKAQRKLESIWSYLNEELGYGTAQNFKSKVFKVLLILERFPEIGTLEVPEKQIRSFAVTSKTQVFYRIRKENVVVLTFFDVRQNPKKKFK